MLSSAYVILRRCGAPSRRTHNSSCSRPFSLLRPRVAAAFEAQMVAEMRSHLLGPRCVGGGLPGRRTNQFGRGQVIERDIALGRAGAAVAPGAEGPRHRPQRGDVLGVVPFVE